MKQWSAEATFAGFAAATRPAIEDALAALLPPEHEEPRTLHRAMRYAMFPGGKRLRPVLGLIACRVSGGDVAAALRPAAALEFLHTYSLVHDDLPCMDDDDLRRGRPTCHKVFGDGVAVLVGDALQALAFEVVAGAGAAAVAALARASGSRGMVGGQVGDLEAESSPPLEDARRCVDWIHDRKTAALIAASLEVGVLAGGGAVECLERLREFGGLLGRAFQIADDCLDVTGTVQVLGKGTGQDAAAGKLTYPAVLGLSQSVAAAENLSARAAALAADICRSRSGPALDADIRLLQDTALTLVARKA